MARHASRQLLITPVAEADIAEIWAYVADDSPKNATAFIEQIQAKFAPLLEFPGMGAPRDKIFEGLRAAPYRNYVIYYVHSDRDVTIIRVVHGARDVAALF